MKQYGSFQIEINDQPVTITYNYYFTPAKLYSKNGDPGFQEEEDITFSARTLKGIDISADLSDDSNEQIEERIRQEINKPNAPIRAFKIKSERNE